MREIIIDLSKKDMFKKISSAPILVGIDGEHNQTKITIILPEILIGEDYTYKWVFGTVYDEKYERDGILISSDNKISCNLDVNLTKKGILECQIEAYKLSDDGTEKVFIGKTNIIPLLILDSVKGTLNNKDILLKPTEIEQIYAQIAELNKNKQEKINFENPFVISENPETGEKYLILKKSNSFGLDEYGNLDVLLAYGLKRDEDGNIVVDTDVIASKEYVDEAKAENKALIEKLETDKANASDVAQNYSNAVKGTGTGTAMALNDVSPISHKVKVSGTASDTVSVYGKNLFITKPKTNGRGYEAIGSTIKITNPTNAYFSNSESKFHDSIVLPAGTYTMSVEAVGEAELASGAYFQIMCKLGDNSLNTWIPKLNTKYSKVCTVDSPTVFSFNQVNMGKVPTSANLSLQIQLEVGVTATDFVESVEGQAFTIDENGKLELDSISPNMTILAESEVTVEYNRDASKIINQQQADISQKENKLVGGYGISISESENEGEKRTVVNIDENQFVDRNQYNTEMANKANKLNQNDSLSNVLIQNTEYYLGDILDSITLTFPSGASLGDCIYINFNAISDITLTIDTSNTSDIDIVPVSGTNYEIFATWNGSIWILGYNEYTVTTE